MRNRVPPPTARLYWPCIAEPRTSFTLPTYLVHLQTVVSTLLLLSLLVAILSYDFEVSRPTFIIVNPTS